MRLGKQHKISLKGANFKIGQKSIQNRYTHRTKAAITIFEGYCLFLLRIMGRVTLCNKSKQVGRGSTTKQQVVGWCFSHRPPTTSCTLMSRIALPSFVGGDSPLGRGHVTLFLFSIQQVQTCGERFSKKATSCQCLQQDPHWAVSKKVGLSVIMPKTWTD